MRRTHQINQLDKTNKANKSHHTTLGIIATLVLSTIVGIGIYSGISIANANTTNALSYSTNEDISFTFAPTLSIGLSTDSLTIDNLVPGTTSDSNTVTVTVSSNTQYGYVLSAGVGSNDTTSPYYNTSSLTHNNSTISNVFSSVDTNASLQSLDTDNTWGYSTSTNGGTSWSTYSGLSHTTTKPLLDISDPAQLSTIDFKIAARSATTQASGTYNNVITFYAVGKPAPLTINDLEYMQEFGTIAESDIESVKDSMSEEVTYTLKDKRDNQDYTIAKLKDGKVWMTKNLNLAGGTEITSELSDIPEGYTLPTANGFRSGNRLPKSSFTFGDSDTMAKLYNSTKTTGTNCSSPGCYSYYSWTAATAGSGLSITTDNTDAPYSICPKGWKLPNSRSTSASDWQSADFYQLAVAYGMNPSDTSQSTSNFYTQAGPGTVANFLLTGGYYSSSFNSGGSNGYYWSSTSYDSTFVRRLYVNSSRVSSADYNFRRGGYAMRCIAE